MINLNSNITFPNVNRWECLDFAIKSGRVSLRFWSPAGTSPAPLWIDVLCTLSDVAGKSSGPILNPAPISWDDKITIKGPALDGFNGVGAANSLTNAQNAYRGAANHNAGLRAVEGQGLTDGWVDAVFNGT